MSLERRKRLWTRRGRLAILPLLLLFGTPSPDPLIAQDDSQDVAGLDPAAVARAIIAADNAGDLDAVLELYAADAELWPPGEPPVRGRALIEERYRGIFASTRLDLTTRIARVRRAEGWALIEGAVHGTAKPRSGGEPRRLNDKYLMVLERSSSGVWKIARLMWSPNDSR